MYPFSEKILQTKEVAWLACNSLFREVDAIAEQNTLKVLQCMQRHKISEYHFTTTSGYAYGDAGREKLEELWADICGAEKALVRTQFVSGTHALATALFGVLRPGDELVSVTGAPYDTMQTVIGYSVPTAGSLKEFGILYKEVALKEDGIDFDGVKQAIGPKTKMVLIQRSRGYSMRSALTVEEIGAVCAAVKNIKPDCICFVDNCYGEFVEAKEPTAVGADLIAGSLIKNPGGGIAPTGGYIAGRADLVDLASYRLTAPGIGSELGASLVSNRLLFQGVFLAPHVVAQAVKVSIFAAEFFSRLGYYTLPNVNAKRSDIIQAVELGSREKLIAFCQGLQHYSPVDSHVKPEPWDMPGYADQVIMAAGAFVQGASIELSADGPMRPPYIAYLQGGLTFEHGVIGIMGAAQAIEDLAQAEDINAFGKE